MENCGKVICIKIRGDPEMKTLSHLTIAVLLLLVFLGNTDAQNNNIDFSILEIGDFYSFTLINKMVYTGKLINLDDSKVELQTESKNIRFKKEYVEKIEKADPILYILNSPDSLIRRDKGLKKVILKDGSEFYGRLIQADSLKLKFKTESGSEYVIVKNQIEEIFEEENFYKYGDDPNKSRLFLAPTGRNLKGGTGYFSVNELLFPIIAFGITDYFTLAGGISLVPGLENQLLYFNGKAGIYQSDELNFSAGLLYTSITSSNQEGLSIIYGNGTYGGSESSLTIGAGYALTKSDNDNYPMLILGGELKISSSTKLITENWISTAPNTAQILSLGIRFFGNKLAGDFGLVMPVDKSGTISGFPFIPWLGFNYNFGM